MREHGYAWQPWADAQPVRAHLAALKTAGIGTQRVAQLAGVSRSVITHVVYGRGGNPPRPRVRRVIAEAILGVDPTRARPAPTATIDGTGTARRVQALVAIGWTLTAQAGRVGWLLSNYAALTQGRPVLVQTADLIRDLYDRMSMTPAPPGFGTTRARRLAQSKGWVPPLAWDDDEIDDPAATPAVDAPTRKPPAARSSEDFVADYRMLAGLGHSKHQIAERLGMSLTAVERQIIRARAAGLLEAVAA